MNAPRSLIISVFMFGATLASSVCAAEPIAMTTDVEGNAWIVEGAKQSRLGLMTYLSRGAKLRLDKDARVAVTYFAVPREYTLNGPMQAVVEANTLRGEGGKIASRSLDPSQSTAGKQFNAKQRDLQAMATFEMKAVGMLSSLQPDNTKMIGQPERFSWQAVSDAERYVFTLRDAQDKTLYHTETTAASVSLPAAIRMNAGKAYRWSVEAYSADNAKQSATARFSLLDDATIRTLEKRKPAPGASFSDRLIYATMLDNVGATYAAKVWWTDLARERPEDEALQQLSHR